MYAQKGDGIHIHTCGTIEKDGTDVRVTLASHT